MSRNEKSDKARARPLQTNFFIQQKVAEANCFRVPKRNKKMGRALFTLVGIGLLGWLLHKLICFLRDIQLSGLFELVALVVVVYELGVFLNSSGSDFDAVIDIGIICVKLFTQSGDLQLRLTLLLNDDLFVLICNKIL